eukprot:scaffold95989_cov18-Prasinocladus_malaysianus.AAC.1
MVVCSLQAPLIFEEALLRVIKCAPNFQPGLATSTRTSTVALLATRTVPQKISSSDSPKDDARPTIRTADGSTL